MNALLSRWRARRARAADIAQTLAELDAALPGSLDVWDQQMRADIRRRTEQIPDDTLDRIWQAIIEYDTEEDRTA